VTPQQVALVQSSFVLMAGEIAPEVRSLFPEDVTERKRKLKAKLETVVANLHRLETILPAMKALAHYVPVGAALFPGAGPGTGFYARRQGRLDGDLWHPVPKDYCAAIFAAAGAKACSISRRSFTAVSVSSIATSA
jgi:hypothetical protein